MLGHRVIRFVAAPQPRGRRQQISATPCASGSIGTGAGGSGHATSRPPHRVGHSDVCARSRRDSDHGRPSLHAIVSSVTPFAAHHQPRRVAFDADGSRALDQEPLGMSRQSADTSVVVMILRLLRCLLGSRVGALGWLCDSHSGDSGQDRSAA